MHFLACKLFRVCLHASCMCAFFMFVGLHACAYVLTAHLCVLECLWAFYPLILKVIFFKGIFLIYCPLAQRYEML